MIITRYTAKLQKVLGIRVKAEPWMHIAIHSIQPEEYGNTGKQTWTFWYAIYVWDTRKVIDEGTADASMTAKQVNVIRNLPDAIDNHAKLQGSGKEVADINEWFNKHPAK